MYDGKVLENQDNRVCAAEEVLFTGKINEKVNFRKNPYVSDNPDNRIIDKKTKKPFMLPKNHKVSILGSSYDEDGDRWYKITTTYNENTYTGYVNAGYVDVDAKEDAEFEKYMEEQGFPDSYKPYLRRLHMDHPKWTFVAVDTGLTWNEALKGEYNTSNYNVKNVVWTSSYSPNYNWRSVSVKYNILKNIWTPCDGSNWFAASNAVVKFYMDPRTYLNEWHIFAFESLSYKSGLHKQAGVETILKNTFMHKAKAFKSSKLYSEIIMSAAKKWGVSPYHLASRIRIEMGSSSENPAANGSYNGCYNYFNIGAYDGANAVIAGLEYAARSGSYGRPWNTVEKSISGGAQFLSSGYISVGQSTLYTQKFNVTNNEDLYGHQYCTNVQMPYTESVTTHTAYANMGAIDMPAVFEIPIYAGLSENASTLPSEKGNPNNYLATLTVSNKELTPAFTVGSRTAYELTVSEKTSSVTIDATPAYSNATVTGTGKVNLEKGTNIVYVNVKAESGSVRKYTLTIVRGKPSDEPIEIEPTEPQVHVGDLNGDGKITAIDIVKVQRIIVGMDKLKDDNLKLADLNGDGKVSAVDIVVIQRHIVGIKKIVW